MKTKANKYDVFISHSVNDNDRVIELASKLEDRGMSIWLDAWSLAPGQEWKQAINEAINDSKYFLVVVGSKGLSKWNIVELTEALKDRDKTIIPIVIDRDNISTLPSSLKERQVVELSDDASIDKLISLLKPSSKIDELNSEVKDLVGEGRFEEALHKCYEAIEIIKKLKLEDESAVAAYNNIGLVFKNQGNYERAIYYYQKALDIIRTKNIISQNTSTESNLANVYVDIGDYEKAKELLEAALASDLKNFGHEHPSIANRQSNLANVYINMGNYEKAKELLEAALTSDLKNFGHEHPSIANRQSNLANVYINMGDYEKAKELLESALTSDMKNFGKAHPTVAIDKSNLANVYMDMGDYEKAKELFEAALTSDLKNFGREHPSIATRQSNLANVYMDTGDYKKAKELLEAALTSDLKNFGTEHPSVAIKYSNLGLAYLRENQLDKSIKYFKKALKIFRDTLGEDHPNTKSVQEFLKNIA